MPQIVFSKIGHIMPEDRRVYYRPMQRPSVSVVIPVYNEELIVRECIRSLFNQTFQPLDVVVVDDGSLDRSVDICRDLGMKVILQEHRGPGAARNLGAKEAKGNILVFIDADMTFAPDYIEHLVAPIIHGKAIATCHWNELVANWENPWARCHAWYFGLPDGLRQPPIPPPYEYVYRAVRKDFFLESGGYSEIEGWGEDSSIAIRTGVLALIVPEAICFHRNAAGMKEVFQDALWRGRNLAVAKKKSLRLYASTILVYKNPLLEIVKGASLSISKKEPRFDGLFFLHSLGFILGALHAHYTGYYLK